MVEPNRKAQSDSSGDGARTIVYAVTNDEVKATEDHLRGSKLPDPAPEDLDVPSWLKDRMDSTEVNPLDTSSP